MGVLECDRNGCPNIMCDRMSLEFGYLCDDCFEEMVQERVMGRFSIEEFMRSTRKSSYEMPEEAMRNYLDEIFTFRRGVKYE